ncbi:MAG: prepilin-type N-terminal cleavage/methylation domain-containing protein [Acaryochloridaceae cyanobacterium RL_2_7]|nr:prepilin-type N-terminal cleavage/methylation domain-containing protein [Acaryochloridaceae cyanobacterium RL_2_7]
MKKVLRLIQKKVRLGEFSARPPRPFWHRAKGHRGFSLVEIMVASLLFSVVMLVAWTGLMSALNMSQQAQAKTARKVELNTALDVLTNEVRQAEEVNRTANVMVGDAVSMEQVVIDAGVNLGDLGNYGDIALYMELPTDSRVKSCDVGGSTVTADEIDKIVYDVRPSPSGWLTPNALVRYGRIPEVDGSINPCSPPIANDILADAIAQTNEKPACDGGVLTGNNGFHTCTTGDNVELLFKSAINDLNIVPISSGVTPRSFSFEPKSGYSAEPAIEESNTVGQLFINHSPSSSKYVQINWGWQDGSAPEGLLSYELDIFQQNPAPGQRKTFGPNTTSYQAHIGSDIIDSWGTVCYRIRANGSNYYYMRHTCGSRSMMVPLQP